MIKNSLFLDPRSSVVCIAPHNPVSIFTGLGRVIYRFVCQCARAGGARRAGAAIANNILISHCLDQSLLRGQHQIIGSPGPSARPHTNNNFYTFLVFSRCCGVLSTWICGNRESLTKFPEVMRTWKIICLMDSRTVGVPPSPSIPSIARIVQEVTI